MWVYVNETSRESAHARSQSIKLRWCVDTVKIVINVSRITLPLTAASFVTFLRIFLFVLIKIFSLRFFLSMWLGQFTIFCAHCKCTLLLWVFGSVGGSKRWFIIFINIFIVGVSVYYGSDEIYARNFKLRSNINFLELVYYIPCRHLHLKRMKRMQNRINSSEVFLCFSSSLSML